MATLNKVFLIGNLTRDPEVRRTPSGVAVAKIGLAVSEKFKNKNGDMEERTCFVDVDVWNRQAEVCEKYLSKGRPLFVEGRLQMDQWKSQSGENRSKLKVTADNIQLLGTPPSGGSAGHEWKAAEPKDAPGDFAGGSSSSGGGSSRMEPHIPAADDEDIPF